MIGVDTNVLLRLMVPEETRESARAASFFTNTTNGPIFVGLIVVVEMVWVLERKYRYSRQASAGAVRFLLDSPDIVVDNAPLVRTAIERVERLGTDIADELLSSLNLAQGCDATMTFDRKASKRVAGMELLK